MPVNFAGPTLPKKLQEVRVLFTSNPNSHTHIAINTLRIRRLCRFGSAVDTAAQLGADALILLADLAALEYAAERWARILSAMFRSGLGNQTKQAISLYHRNFDVHRVVPPRTVDSPCKTTGPRHAEKPPEVRVSAVCALWRSPSSAPRQKPARPPAAKTPSSRTRTILIYA